MYTLLMSLQIGWVVKLFAAFRTLVDIVLLFHRVIVYMLAQRLLILWVKCFAALITVERALLLVQVKLLYL